jgi:hypothetical protein
MPVVPPPPDFTSSKPRIFIWGNGRPIIRVHKTIYAATEFSPGAAAGIAGRFHFFQDSAGMTVSVLYGAETEDAAIAETIFRDVPVMGPSRILLKSKLTDLSIATIVSKRDLKLAELFGFGLRRLGVRPEQLTATEASEYQFTVPCAKALYDAFDTMDGFIWMSRHFNASKAMVIFGSRVSSAELETIEASIPLAVPGPGLTKVYEAANKADITIV